MIPASPLGRMASLQAGSGISAVESRVAQLEAMIRAVEEAQTPAKPFQAYLQGPAGKDVPKPDAFYLQSGKAGALPRGLSARAQAFQPLVSEAAERYGVDKHLVNAVIRQESGFNPAAVSHAGARGLMQLMPATAKSLGVDAADPAQNIDGGVRYLKGLLDRFNGNIPLALAAYNAGPGAVTKYGGVPPYRETQNYVRNILAQYLKGQQEKG